MQTTSETTERNTKMGEKSMDREFYFTFGVNTPLADYVQPVRAETEGAARRGMSWFYGKHWAACYDEEPDSSGRYVTYLPAIRVQGNDVWTEVP